MKDDKKLCEHIYDLLKDFQIEEVKYYGCNNIECEYCLKTKNYPVCKKYSSESILESLRVRGFY